MNMSTPLTAVTRESIRDLREDLAEMTNEQRLEVFSEIMADYCDECGRYDGHSTENKRGCQCWNDE